MITEKSLSLAARGKYTFEVKSQAKKPQIAQAVEETFGVHVISLKTVNLPGKKRHSGRRRREITTTTKSKAIVQLAPEEKIDLFTVPGGEEAKK